MKPRPPLKAASIKLVVFDLDGTLVDAYRAIMDSVNHMLKSKGRPPKSLRAVKRSVGWGVDTLVRTFVDEHEVEAALKLFRDHHDKRLRRNLRLLPGTKTVLAFLKKKGCLLAIASNRPTRFCRIILETLGIDRYFDFVICGDAVKRAKPHPDMLIKIMRAAKASAGETVFVGDMSVDVLAGRRAGVMTVAVPTGSCTLRELVEASPAHIIKRLTEVKRLLK